MDINLNLLKTKLLGLLSIQNKKRLGYLANTINNNKKFIVVTIILSVLASVIYYYANREYSAKVSVVLSYNYKGIEKGLDPAGRNLDTSMIESDKVLQNVIKVLDLKKFALTKDSLKDCIDVIPLVSGNAVEKVKSVESKKTLNINDSNENIYFPCKYKVSLNVPKRYGINNTMAKKILDVLAKEYRTYFNNKYSDNGILDKIVGEVEYDDYDYPELSTIISNQIYLITSFLTNKANMEDGADFKSPKTNVTFNDIKESVNVVKNVDLDKMNSLISMYNLTKDKPKLIKRYQHRIRRYELRSKNKNDESYLATNMLDKYQKEKSFLVLPNMDNELANSVNQIEVTGEDSYYNELAKRSTESGVESKEALHNANYYQSLLTKLENDQVSNDVKKKMETDAIKLIDGIKVKLNKWIGIANITVDDFYANTFYKKAINIGAINTGEIIDPMLFLYMITALVGGFTLSLVFSGLRDYLEKKQVIVNKRKKAKAYI